MDNQPEQTTRDEAVASGGREHIPKIHQQGLSCASFLGVACGSDEEVLMVIHRHWIFELVIALQGVIVAGWPVVLWAIFQTELSAWRLPVLLAIFFYVQFTLLWLFKRWLDFYLDVIVVTTQKIIDIDQEGFFDRRVSETSLARVQDAGGKLQGFIGTIFNYGTVDIQTAGNEAKFTLTQVGHPMKTAAAIQRIQAEYLAQIGSTPAGHESLVNEV